MQSRSDDRSGFYTAQKDLVSHTPKAAGDRANGAAAAKKATAAKRVSNAMISEQLNAVYVAQMKLLSQKQDRLENAAGVSASHAPEPPLGAASKLPPAQAFEIQVECHRR